MQRKPHLRFDPTTPIFWRQSGSFVIGYPDSEVSSAIEVTAHMKQVATWLALADGTRDESSLEQSGAALGIPLRAIRELMKTLTAAGHLFEFETLPAEAAIGTRLHSIRFQAASQQIGIKDLLEQRQSFPIEIVGAGCLPLLTQQILNQLAFPVSWRPGSNRRIRPEDIPESFPAKLIGKRWNELSSFEVEPRLQIVFSDTYQPENLPPPVPQLPVVWHSRRVAIGPVLNIKSSHNPSCLHEARLKADPEWNFVLSQLLHNQRPLPRLADPWLELSANQIALIATNLSNGKFPIELLQHSYEIAPPNSIWQKNPWPLSGCGCGLKIA